MRKLFALCCLSLALFQVAFAQNAPKADDQITKLESDLSKQRDSSPEAAETMVKLASLYEQEGRVFGLIRVGQSFSTTHLTHPQHKAMMLKLLDGLQATSRNKEIVTTARQFLQRYANDPAASGKVEMRLASALDQLDDRPRAAEAHDAVWQRQGNSPDGIQAALRAIVLYESQNAKPAGLAAATIAEAAVDKLPAGELSTRFGLQAVSIYHRFSEWAKSNAAGLKLIKKNAPMNVEQRTALHSLLAQNDANLGQRMNAVENIKKVRAIYPTRDLLVRQIGELNAANALPELMQPLVDEYFQKYPTREDRFTYKALLPAAYLRAKNKDRAIAILRELVPELPNDLSTAALFVQEFADKPEAYPEAEKVLLAAIAKNPANAVGARYVLALNLYRDRVKDLDKARKAARELIAQSNHFNTWSTDVIGWLWGTPENDQAFQNDVKLVLQVREAQGHLAFLRGYPKAWFQQVKSNKDLKDRATLVRDQADAADKSATLALWVDTESTNAKNALESRAKLVSPGFYEKLSDIQARLLLVSLAEGVRYVGAAESRARSIEYYGRAAKRFPKDYPLAQSYLEVCTDHGTPEIGKEAALTLLKLDPPGNNSEVYRRLLWAADKAKDPALAKSAWTWITAAMQKYGFEPGNASYCGDVLDRLGMTAEALAHWKKCIEVIPNNYESRTCAERLLAKLPPEQKQPFLKDLLTKKLDYHGQYAWWLAQELLKSPEPNKFADLPGAEKVLRDSRKLQDERGIAPWGIDDLTLQQWMDGVRTNAMIDDATKKKVYTLVNDMRLQRSRAVAQLALLEMTPPEQIKPLQHILNYQAATTFVGNDAYDWDVLMTYAQAAMIRKDYTAAATLVTGMLANVPNADAKRKQTGRDIVGQSYARMGAAGLSIDESSPIAPLLQAALYLRLGDERLAFDTYSANRKLFDENREQMPVDLVLFVCDNHIAAGGDENHDRAEDILRGWLIKFSEAKDIEDNTKASVQLLLAKNFFKSQRYDVARSEFQTVVNRYGKTPQAIEAEFGIGEAYMSQKVYDQAELVFDKLVNSKDRDVVIRAEFLRGVLANRRGDRDEAREIFKNVLDRVPSIELANQALFNLAEVYGAEQRYMDQLELLRTVGRLGRTSQRWHAPGMPVAIVVQDSDLGISRGHARIPVKVTTEPGGDEEIIYLYSGGAGKGLFRADLETRLGKVTKSDKVLQLTGRDTIRVDYPEEFKAEFKSVPLSDTEIRVASDAKFEVASAKIVDDKEETFSERLEREARERENQRTRAAEERPKNQVKPGNLVYVRVQDPDRDMTDDADQVTVKLVATSGDQVQVKLTETGPHTGIFEATAHTGDLPAGALSSDTSIEHTPLMAIDKDPKSYWLSEPDGATPKMLSVDMKDLRTVDHVTIAPPKPDQQVAVRGEIEASNDGRFWFRLGSYPPQDLAESVTSEGDRMTRSIYEGNYTSFTKWDQVLALAKNQKPSDQSLAQDMSYTVADEPEGERVRQKPHAAIWHGKLVQPIAGAARFQLTGSRNALAIDGRLELPLGDNVRTVDVWLEQGTHDVTVFTASAPNVPALGAQISREDHSATQIKYVPFVPGDFDLTRAEAKPAQVRKPSVLEIKDGVWDLKFDPIAARHVRFNIREYLGEAVAISQFSIRSDVENKLHIPTDADVLSLSTNETLEIAAGDKVTATYADELTQLGSGRSQLLSATLLATYHNGRATTINFDFVRQPSGVVQEVRKETVRIDPGQRFIVEISDFDMDVSEGSDALKFQVSVNNGEPLELTALELGQQPGIFTKEVDTSATAEEGKLTVKAGDRIYVRYVDTQNTFPGHAVPREVVVYVAEPSNANVYVIETRYLRPKAPSNAPARTMYLPGAEKPVANVAFEAPLTVEVIDPDAARDSRSTVTVQLTTTTGVKVDVDCVIAQSPTGGQDRKTIEDGRFIGQIILQLGGKDSPDIVPVVAGMPRNLLGGSKLPEESAEGEETIVTRVLNLTGKDIVTASYKDAERSDGMAKDLAAQGRLIANGELACVDRDYEKPITQLHVGEKLFLRVADADLDTSDDRDRALVTVTTERGDKETIELEETLTHSGLFTGSILLKPQETPVQGNSTPEAPMLETYFGDKITVQYLDKSASTENGELLQSIEVPVVIGTDGLVAAFSKTFGDETLAVETQFHIAESYFELFKSHQKLERSAEQRSDLESGRRVLREVMEDYSNPKYIPRIAYLLGQFSQELKEWSDAVDNYQLIVKQYPDSTLAADAQYKLAQCYEEAGDFDQALEAYVTLAATYPKSPLIANVMVRIAEYFFKNENFEISAQVGEKFLERFQGHEWGPRIAFRVGTCYYKAKEFSKAGKAFDEFIKVFPDDELCAMAYFWSGESWRMGANVPEAFRRYNNCRWKFPSSEAAKYALGRLALPEMLRQFEAEANVEQ